MKKLFTLLIGMSIFFSSQASSPLRPVALGVGATWLTDAGLPESLSIYENQRFTSNVQYRINMIVTQKQVRVPNPGWMRPNRTKIVWAIDTTFATDSTISGNLTGGVLNWLHSQYYEFNDGTFTETPDGLIIESGFASELFRRGDPTLYYTTIEVKSAGTGHRATVVPGYPYMNADYPFSKVNIAPGAAWINITRINHVVMIDGRTTSVSNGLAISQTDIERKSGWTMNDIAYHTRLIWRSEYSDPASNINSIFGLVTRSGDVYTNATLVNGKIWTDVSNWKGKNIVMSQAMQTMKFTWVVLNDCAVTAQSIDGNSTGNFGECYRFMSPLYVGNTTEFNPNSVSITIIPGSTFARDNTSPEVLTINSNSTNPPIVWIVPSYSSRMPEKNTAADGYYNIRTDRRIYSLRKKWRDNV